MRQVWKSIKKKRNGIILLVLGDSWEHEFDETDLRTSKTNLIPVENPTLPVITAKKADKEFDDEWESWS